MVIEGGTDDLKWRREMDGTDVGSLCEGTDRGREIILQDLAF